VEETLMQVGGYSCPTSGEIAGRDAASDAAYFLTTFGGGADAQSTACGSMADGTWFYTADSWRWPCGTKLLITNPSNGRSAVAQVADVGPNVCVEQAAGGPVIDASPLVAQHLFGTSSLGWSSRSRVVVNVADPSTPLGPTDAQAVVPAAPQSSSLMPLVVAGLLGIAAWSGYKTWQTMPRHRRRTA
jgi:hypothetical protein